MRISAARDHLKQALEICAKVINAKSHREVLRCVKFEARNGKATLSTTDLEEWLSVEIEGAKIEAEGVAILNFTELRLFVKDAGRSGDIGIETDAALVKVSAEIAGSRISRSFKSWGLPHC